MMSDSSSTREEFRTQVVESALLDLEPDQVPYMRELFMEEVSWVGDELVWNNASATGIICRFGEESDRGYGAVATSDIRRGDSGYEKTGSMTTVRRVSDEKLSTEFIMGFLRDYMC